jgi:hypothetical protein
MNKLQRIKAVLEYYRKKGHNSERINNLYHKILKDGKENT